MKNREHIWCSTTEHAKHIKDLARQFWYERQGRYTLHKRIWCSTMAHDMHIKVLASQFWYEKQG
eukprot:c22313_g3_i1 orf=55-246(-)